MFDNYELLEELGRGGMGVVYKAREIGLSRIVALKMILAAEFASPSVIQRFRMEAKTAAMFEHPGIVPIYELGTFGDHHPFFSMKLVKGHTLAQLLEERNSVGWVQPTNSQANARNGPGGLHPPTPVNMQI